MTRAALALAALLALLLARRAPSSGQRGIALTLAALLAIDVGRPFFAAWPVLYVAGFVLWYAVTAGGVGAVLAPHGLRAGLLFVPLAALAGEAVRRGMTTELARASFALALALQLVALARFVSRGQKPSDAQRAALILVASGIADLAGPWLLGEPSKDWHVGRAIAVSTWIVVSADQVRALWRTREG